MRTELQDAVERRNVERSNVQRSNDGVVSNSRGVPLMAPGTAFHSTWDITAPMRAIKDEEEIRLMRQAALVSDAIFDDVRQVLKFGILDCTGMNVRLNLSNITISYQ